MTILSLYLCLAAFVINPINKNDDINSLFSDWNKATFNSLTDGVKNTNSDEERSIFQNRLSALTEFDSFEDDSLKRASLRWKFLEQIESEFRSNRGNWTIIELTKSGERVMIINYLICYDKAGRATIMKYSYEKNGWNKDWERKVKFKITDLSSNHTKVPFGTSNYPYDVIISNFRSKKLIQSTYFVPSTLSDDSKIVALITSKG